MRTFLKYFILLTFLQACKVSTKQSVGENTPLYAEPVSIPLNIAEGYTTNQFTGDPIKPIINSFGDTVRTGIPAPFKGNGVVGPLKISKPKSIKAGSPIRTIIKSNIQPVTNNPVVIPVDTMQLKKVKLGKGEQFHILKNSFAIIPTGVAIPVTGKKMPFSEPPPVHALPLRSKDAATASIQYLDVEQGMSNSFIYGICEDKRGNLWFGTDGNGVSKYDGVNFIHYTTKEGLPNNIVTSVLEDRRENLWFGTHNGIAKFDGTNFIQFAEKEAWPGNIILSLMEDSKGNIWFTTVGSGAGKYDGKNITYYSRKEGLPSDTVYTCMEDSRKNLWFGTAAGAAKFDGETFTYLLQKDGLAIDAVNAILEDNKGNIWLTSGNTFHGGFVKYDGQNITQYFKDEGLPNTPIWSTTKDSNGNIWIGSSFGGIIKFDGKSFTKYNLKEGLSNNKVRTIIEDRNRNIWFSTDGGGVNKLNDTGFSYIISDEVIENNRIRPILKDKTGSLWMGTEGGGFGKYEQGSFFYYPAKWLSPALGQRSILQDSKGNLWVGTTGNGLVKYDGDRFLRYSIAEGVSDITVFSLLEDWKNNIWIGTSINGVDRYDGKNFIHYSEKEGMPAKKIFSMLEDRQHNIWFCTEGAGICKYDGINIIIYSEKEGLPNNSITSITEDKQGSIWLGTLGAGICKFDGKNFTSYTEKQGLSNNNVWSITLDSAGHIWAGTDKGLNLFIADSNNKYIIHKFGLNDGLKALDFNLRSVSIDNNNRIWWGTGKGVVSLDLNNKFKTATVRSLGLSHIKINDRLYDYSNFPDSLSKKVRFSSVIPFSNYPGNLSLSYDQNHLSFYFSAIDWSAPDKIKYSYRLIGLDNKWSIPTADTKVDYRNLSHGKYTFEIKAIGQSQVWTAPFTYSFTIRPAWWQTWWCKTLSIAAILILFFFIGRFIYFYQLRKQRTALEKKLAVQYERQRISAEMHDDIGAGLSGIRLLTEITKNKVKDEKTAEEVEKIYQSVGDISSKMKEVIWSLNTENDDLSNLVLYIQKQVRLWLEHYPCQLNINIPDAIPNIQVSGDARRNIFLLIKESIHNIIKHSEASKVNLAMIYNNKQFVITVADNGKGFITEQTKETGNGMKNMRKRIQQLNGKLTLKNQEGFTLVFEIPLKTTL